MFKRIKEYFIRQRKIQMEILETLCTICLYLEFDGHYDRNRYAKYMQFHYTALKRLAEELRDKPAEDDCK